MLNLNNSTSDENTNLMCLAFGYQFETWDSRWCSFTRKIDKIKFVELFSRNSMHFHRFWLPYFVKMTNTVKFSSISLNSCRKANKFEIIFNWHVHFQTPLFFHLNQQFNMFLSSFKLQLSLFPGSLNYTYEDWHTLQNTPVRSPSKLSIEYASKPLGRKFLALFGMINSFSKAGIHSLYFVGNVRSLTYA